MKRASFLSLILVLVFSGMAYATDPHADATATIEMTNNGAGGSILSPSAVATGGAGGSVTINKDAIKNTNTNLNVNTNVFDPKNTNVNKNLNIGIQDMNNKQEIKPVQTVLFESPVQLPNIPSASIPELNFGNGRLKDATKDFPKIAAYGIDRLDPDKDTIRDVLIVKDGVKFKNLYKTIIETSKDLTGSGSKTAKKMRYQIIRHESNTSRVFGVVINGGGTGVVSSGLGGGAGGGGIGPQWGRTSADDLFDIVFADVI